MKTESELEPEYVAEADTGDNLINLVSQPVFVMQQYGLEKETPTTTTMTG